ncbi:hypothetical protein KGO06_00610 [Patescibacteria group bacterium]|nr:hypothetical protein [Patescibacteria group bacterium]
MECDDAPDPNCIKESYSKYRVRRALAWALIAAGSVWTAVSLTTLSVSAVVSAGLGVLAIISGLLFKSYAYSQLDTHLKDDA